ncbi:hypothetical protein [Streptomyces antibioticus]|uniref:Serine/arginine repetitive matrix protein 2 n=1 Tax=Streptomyces antibioticus TaxID=1890 RepID=A0AAE6Y371_STRAT|nr:hypothetical protein [Streptomyces antibioticus]QIT42498.1 hypothetical protein HCX60_02355 [Streptomyces antibioticus]
MRVFDTERQEWAGSRRERLFHPEQYLDLPRQRFMIRRTAAVLSVCALAFATWALGWKDEPEPYRPPSEEAPVDPGGTDDGATGEGTSDGGTASGPTAAESPSPPAGFEVLEDSEGFRIALPQGWSRESSPSQYGIDVVEYRGPDGVRRVQVFQLMEDSPHASVVEAQRAGRKLEGYREIHLQYVPDPSEGEAAEHEYTADELSGEPSSGSSFHVIDYRFRAEDSENYALIVYGSESDGDEDERELLDTARAWFCPPSTQCAAPSTP